MTTTSASKAESRQRLKDLFRYALLQLRTLEKPYAGVLHLLIFWGVVIQVIGTAIKMMQMGLFVPFTWPLFSKPGYLAYELVMDLAGAAILIGVFLAVIRRWLVKPSYLENTWETYYTLGLLFLMPLVGFLTEGLRLLSVDSPFSIWSPVGNLTAGFLGALGVQPDLIPRLHPYLFWAHVGLGLVFAASIPFTRFRHILTTPLHIFRQTYRPAGELETIEDLMESDVLGAEQVSDFSSRELLSFDACLQCGRCEEVCPATISGMNYSPRVLLKRLRENMAERLVHPRDDQEGFYADLISEDMLWSCTTCGACLDVCPAFIRPPENVVDIRRSQVLMAGNMPAQVGETLRNYERQGNPWGFPPQDRTAWTEGLQVRILEPGDEVDVLFFVGCAGAFDERNRRVTRSFTALLNKIQCDFGILGQSEMCCGETARRMGNEYLFQVSAEENIAVLESITFNTIITLCPHGFNTLKHEYPRFGGSYQVQHGLEYLKGQLSGTDMISSPATASDRVSYHDSCYLGRYNNVYTQPRELLQQAGYQTVEMAESHQNSFCCGGGGGAMWLETDPETRISRKRLEHARNVQADTIATACPFCLIMLDDAVRSQGLSEDIQVLDVVELLHKPDQV